MHARALDTTISRTETALEVHGDAPVDAAALASLIAAFTHDQLLWASGYLAGLAWARAGAAGTPLPAPASAPATSAGAAPQWTVLYGSQTGHGRGVAERLAASLADAGVQAKLASMSGFTAAQLKKVTHLLLVVSTHGDGDPPDDALELYEYVTGPRAPRLEHLSYAVLALGDSSYAQFCATGRILDERLAALGATRMFARVECDVDYEEPAARWREQVLAAARERAAVAEPAPRAVRLHAVPAVPRHDRAHPFEAELLVAQPIVGRGSTRDVRHVELSLEGSGLRYEPGDSLAILPSNPPTLVAQLLETLDLDGDAPVTTPAGATSLADALATRYDITILARPFIEAYATLASAESLGALLAEDRRAELAAYIAARQPIDVVREHPARVTPQQLVDALRRLTPRLYSIASDQEATPDEVHLTVAVVRYDAFGFPHWGAASTMLGERTPAGARVPIHVERNERFRLPADPATPIVMIGPGTGVAPFRAFMQRREAEGATGRNWLFFGERNFR